MNILLTGAGGAAAISVWKSLHKQHTLFMADMDPCASGLYLVPKSQRTILPPIQAPDYEDALFHVCQQKRIDVLIPTIDAELIMLAKRQEEYHKINTQIPISPLAALELCRDKNHLLAHCSGNPYSPKSWVLQTDTLSLLKQQRFPLFAKPRKGAGSKGAQSIDNIQALEHIPQDGSYLVQEMLTGDEYSVDTYINQHGQVLAAVPRIRLKIDSGIAVASQTVHHSTLEAYAIDIAHKVGLRFVANIQFKANSQGQFKLLEINPRFPGTLPLTVAAGIDIPNMLLQDLQGTLTQQGLMPFKELMVVRYWTEQYCSIAEWKALCRD